MIKMIETQSSIDAMNERLRNLKQLLDDVSDKNSHYAKDLKDSIQQLEISLGRRKK